MYIRSYASLYIIISCHPHALRAQNGNLNSLHLSGIRPKQCRRFSLESGPLFKNDDGSTVAPIDPSTGNIKAPITSYCIQRRSMKIQQTDTNSHVLVTVDMYPDFKWDERLVWAPLQIECDENPTNMDFEDNAGVTTTTMMMMTTKSKSTIHAVWWPALVYTSIADFDKYHGHVEDKSHRTNLLVRMLQRVHLSVPDVYCIEFLGRPLMDVQIMEEKDFISQFAGGHLSHVLHAISCQPQYFVERLPQMIVQSTYHDFHRAMDLAMHLLGQRGNNAFQLHGQEKWKEWESNQQEQPRHQRQLSIQEQPVQLPSVQQRIQSIQGNTRSESTGRSRPPASPSHSVTAVSIVEESTESTPTDPPVTPASTVATTDTSHPSIRTYGDQDPSSHPIILPTYHGWPDSMEPLGDIPWKEAHPQLFMMGWARYLDEDGVRYQFRGEGPSLTLSQIQTLANERYGWRSFPIVRATTAVAPTAPRGPPPPPPTLEATQHYTPSPSKHVRRRRNACEPPSTNARNYSFGFLWKHKLLPEGWKRIPPKGADAKIFDFYYLRPHVNQARLAEVTRGADYFDDHWAVLDWCRKQEDFFRGLESSASEAESVASTVADDPSTYLEGMEEHEVESDDEDELPVAPTATTASHVPKKKCKKLNKKQKSKMKSKKSNASQKNYSFGVLWATHLEPQGWTMPRAKRNSLIDYYYVRPDKSTSGILGEDYFQSTDQVLDWCRRNNDYPPSSSPEQSHSGTRYSRDGTISSHEEDGDESTKHPTETEDDHTIGDQTEYSTPGNRTRPQDPSRPLLREEEEDEGTAPLTDEEKYNWNNLWPFLQKLGWRVRKAPNPLDHWHYERPRRLSDDSGERIRGKHYFTTPEEVIAHNREMDRLERMGISHSDCEEELHTHSVATRIGETVSETRPTKKAKQGVNSIRDDNEIVSKMAARKKSSKAQKQSLEDRASDVSKTNKRPSNFLEDKRPVWLKIRVDIEPDKNQARWAKYSLRKVMTHNLALQTGGFRYSGSRYMLPGDASIGFEHFDEIMKYYARLGPGNYYISPKAEPEDKEFFVRLVNNAFCPGTDYEHCRTRQLEQSEIEACLTEMFYFKKDPVDGRWHDTRGFSRGENLKASYDSLPSLLRDLRRIEDLDGTSSLGRKRKPMGREALEFVQKERLYMAFRLSIADDAVVDNLHLTRSHDSDSGAPAPKKRAASTSKPTAGTQKASTEFQRESGSDSLDAGVQLKSTENGTIELKKKRPSTSVHKSDSAKKRDFKEAEAKRTEKSIRENTFRPFNKGDMPNKAIRALVEVPDFMWDVAKKLGVVYVGGLYHLPDRRYGMNYPAGLSPSLNSTDKVFRHLGTYGGYDLKDLSEEKRLAAKLEIARANVTGKRSEWKAYRLIEEHEAVTFLHTLGFERPVSGAEEWVVPDRLLHYTNPYVQGQPPLLKEKYETTNELRIALRCFPDLAYQPGEKSRRRESTLNNHLMTSLRLWIACGPEGPDAVTYDSQPSGIQGDQPVSPACPSSPGSQSITSEVHEELPSPIRRADLFTQPQDSEDEGESIQEAIADLGFESPNHGLLTQAQESDE